MSAIGCRTWRNNSGVLINPAGVPIRFGLGNESARINKICKSPDLMGIVPVKIRAEHVGLTLGVVLAVEVKHEGWIYSGSAHEKAQYNFLKQVSEMGGLAGFADNSDDFIKLISGIR